MGSWALGLSVVLFCAGQGLTTIELIGRGRREGLSVLESATWGVVFDDDDAERI